MSARPIRVTWNTVRRTSFLTFPEPEQALSGEYFMRGAVCWPITTTGAGVKDAEGYLLLAGYRLTTKRIHVFEEQAFQTVDPVTDPENKGRLIMEGAASFLNRAWALYGATSFFWNQDERTHQMFYRMVRRSDVVQPKPRFIHVPWEDDRQAEDVVWRVGMGERRIVLEKDSPMLETLRRYQQLPPGDPPPPFRALMTLLSGLERWPWRERPAQDGGQDFPEGHGIPGY